MSYFTRDIFIHISGMRMDHFPLKGWLLLSVMSWMQRIETSTAKVEQLCCALSPSSHTYIYTCYICLYIYTHTLHIFLYHMYICCFVLNSCSYFSLTILLDIWQDHSLYFTGKLSICPVCDRAENWTLQIKTPFSCWEKNPEHSFF